MNLLARPLLGRALPGPGGAARHPLALLLTGLFVCLGILYSIVNPILESPDEIHHYGYIQYLSQSHNLPVQRVGTPSPYEQEGSQPPLYYVLSAVLTGMIDPADNPLTLQYNPQVRTGIALARDNHNTLVHSSAEAWPWRGEVLRIHLVRLISILLGASTVWGTYRLGLALFPRNDIVALGGMAFVALNPQFIFINSSVNNDSLVTSLATWALLALLLVLQRGLTVSRTALLGVLVGLAGLAKVSGLALVPLVVVVLAIASVARYRGSADAYPERLRVRLGLNRASVARWIGHTALALGVAAAVAGWWYLRNHWLYGEFTGTRMMLDIFGRRYDVFTLPDIIAEYRGFRISYWGLFGSFNVMIRPVWIYGVLEAIAAFGSLGVVRWICVAVRAPSGNRCGHPQAFWFGVALLAGWIAAMYVLLLQWTMLTRASQGRLVFPAIAASSLLIAWGLCAWLPARLQRVAMALAVVPFLVVSIIAPWSTIAPAYAGPPRLTLADIPADAVAIGNTYEDVVRLVAVEQDRTEIAPGETLTVTLYWQALKQVDEDLLVYVHVLGRDRKIVGQRDSLAGMGVLTTRRWLPGEVIRDRYDLRVDAQAEAPVAGQVTAGLYRQDTMTRLLFTDGIGRATEQTGIGYVKLTGQGQPGDPANEVDMTFGEGVRLLGYTVTEDVGVPGEALSVTLYWRTARQTQDYTVFVHLVTSDGTSIGRGDGPPMGGEYPTSLWGWDEHIADEHEVRVDPTAPPGPAEILVGLYAEDGMRLPVMREGRPAGDQASLGTVTIAGP